MNTLSPHENGGLILLPSSSDSPLNGNNNGHHYGRTTESSLISGSGNEEKSRPESLSSCFTINLPRNPNAFNEIELTNPLPVSTSVEPFGSWSASFVQSSNGFLRFHFIGLPPWARLAFLAGKNEPPSLTQHEQLELINPTKHNTGSGSGRFKKRDSDPRDSKPRDTVRQGISVELLDFFESGTWYITIINDGQETVPLVMNISNALDVRTHCINDCNGHGKCHLGKCQCFPGYIGHDCADSKYTLRSLCTTHFVYISRVHFLGSFLVCSKGTLLLVC